MARQLISSGGPFEDVVGYSRAVRTGNHVYVSGTTSAMPDGTVYGDNDAYAQAKRCFEIIEKALAEAGATWDHVVRTRMFVTDIGRWEDFAKAHREFLKWAKPAATMVQVAALIDPRMLVEIEVDAVIDD
ncbi:MAG: RidA family protein [Dehalococcoidia bacterium]|nr:RidA family protein [Dehalococcoidia bacterium]